MPFEQAPAEVFMVHRGVPIYHVYRHDMMTDGSRRDYHYSFYEYNSDEDNPGEDPCFDIRELPNYVGNSREEHLGAIANAIDSGYFDGWEHQDGTPVLENLDKPYLGSEAMICGMTERQRRFLCCVIGYWLNEQMDELPVEVTGQIPGGQMTRSEARDIVLLIGGDPDNPRGD